MSDGSIRAVPAQKGGVSPSPDDFLVEVVHELCLGGRDNEWAGNGRCQGTETESPHVCGKRQAAECGWSGKREVTGDEAGGNSKSLGGCEGARNLDFILQV